MIPAKQSRVPFVAVSEWVMILPAAVFLVAAALRELQPRQYEPARTSWLIFSWTVEYISRFGAAVLFLGLPCLALTVGCGLLIQKWHRDEVFRQDVLAAFSALRRHTAIAFVTVATALAAAIFLFTVVHIFTD